jgi:hypothetical protein
MKVMLLSLPGIGEDGNNSLHLGIGYFTRSLKPITNIIQVRSEQSARS